MPLSAPTTLGSITGGVVSSVAITTTANIVANNAVIVAVGILGVSGPQVASITDGTNNYYPTQALQAEGTTIDNEIWACLNPSPVSSGSQITVTLTENTNIGGAVVAAAAQISTAIQLIFDGAGSAEAGGSITSTGNIPVSSGTLLTPNEALITSTVAYSTGTAITITESSGFTTLYNISLATGQFQFDMAYQLTLGTAPVTYSPNISVAGGGGATTFYTILGSPFTIAPVVNQDALGQSIFKLRAPGW
jgi:hypothetical protein